MPLIFPGSRKSSPDIIVPDHIPPSFHILYRKKARIAFNDAKYEAELAMKLASESQKPVVEEVPAVNPLDSWDDVFEQGCQTELASDPVKSNTDTTSMKDVYAALKEAAQSLSAKKQKFLETLEEAPACRDSTAAKVAYDFEAYDTFVGNFAKEAEQRYATSLAPSKYNGVRGSTRGAPSNDVVAPEMLKTIGRHISDLSVSGPKPSSTVSEKMVCQPEVDNQNEFNQHAGPSENRVLSTDNDLRRPSACNSSSGVEIIHPQPVRCISSSIGAFEISAQPNTTNPEEFSEPTTAANKSAQSVITQEVVNDLPRTNVMREMEEVQKLKEPVGLTVAGVGVAKPNALENVQHDTSSQEIILNANTTKSEGHLTSSVEKPIRSSGSVVPMTREVQIPQPCSEIGIASIEEHNLQKVVPGTSRTVPEFGYQDRHDGSHLSTGPGSDEASSVGRVTQVDSVKIGRPSSTVIGNAGGSIGRSELELPARNPKKPATEGSSDDGINWPDPHPGVCSPEVFKSWEDYDARKGDISIFPHYIEENRFRNSTRSGNRPSLSECQTIYHFGKVVQSIIPRPGENRPPLRAYPPSNPAPVVDHSVPVVGRHPERNSSILAKTRRIKPPKVTSRAYQETLQIDSKGAVRPGRWNPYLRKFEILSRYNMREPDDGLDFNGHKRRRGRSFNGSPLPGVPTRNCDHLEFKDVDAIGGPGKWSSSESGQSNLGPRGGAEAPAPGNDNLVGSSAEPANGNYETEAAREPLKLIRENLSVRYPSLDKIISGFLKTLNRNFPDIPESDNLTEDDYPFTHPVDPKTIPVRPKYHFTKSGRLVWDDCGGPSVTENPASTEAEELTESWGVSVPEVSEPPKAEKSVEKEDRSAEVSVPPKAEEPAERSGESPPEVSASPKAENSVKEEDQLLPKVLVPLETEKPVEEALAPSQTEKPVEKEDQPLPKVAELLETEKSAEQALAPPKAEGSVGKEDKSPPSKIEKSVEAPEPPKTEKSVGKEDQSPPEVLEALKTEKSVEEEGQSPPKTWARINGVWVPTTEKVTYVITPRIPEYTRQQDQKL